MRWGVEKRLEFIEFRLFWEGGINRADIMEQFGVSVPQASKDLSRFEPVGDHQNTDMSLMDFGLSQMRLAALARDATQYELVGPVLRISADGEVAHV